MPFERGKVRRVMVVKFHFMKFDGNITESWQEDKLNREKFSTADTLGRLSLLILQKWKDKYWEKDSGQG